MIQLQSPSKSFLSDSSYIGIAISGDQNQRHVGILFRRDKINTPELLHLAFHMHLRCEAPGESNIEYYLLHCPNLSEDEQLQLAVWFKQVFLANNKNIPYGIEYSSIRYFSDDGTYLLLERNCGLTCSTFVLALFRDFAYELVDIDSWEKRSDDEEWQKNIIKSMKSQSERHSDLYPATYIDAQVAKIGIAVRFRPEEVAVSAHLCDGTPIKFDEAKREGENLLLQMGLQLR